MKELIKPERLHAGDTVAAISISGGRAGDADMLPRYLVGKERLKSVFGLEVVETPNALKGNEFIYSNPKARVDDLNWALENPEIKGIITNMGGDDSYRLLPYIDYENIRRHPKILMGYSDISTTHNMFTKAGVMSYYGPNLLTPLAQPGSLDAYTEKWIRKVLFSGEIIGEVEASERWTPIDWNSVSGDNIEWTANTGYKIINGHGKVTGRLIGGCCGPMQQIMGTEVFPSADCWKDSLLFLEIGSSYGVQLTCLHTARAFAAAGVFRQAKGMVCQGLTDADAAMILRVIRDEEGLKDFPILSNVELTHRTPMTVLPIGAAAEIDCDNVKFSILESGAR